MCDLDVSGHIEKDLTAGLTDLRLGAEQPRQFRLNGGAVIRRSRLGQDRPR